MKTANLFTDSSDVWAIISCCNRMRFRFLSQNFSQFGSRSWNLGEWSRTRGRGSRWAVWWTILIRKQICIHRRTGISREKLYRTIYSLLTHATSDFLQCYFSFRLITGSFSRFHIFIGLCQRIYFDGWESTGSCCFSHLKRSSRPCYRFCQQLFVHSVAQFAVILTQFLQENRRPFNRTTTTRRRRRHQHHETQAVTLS